MLSASEIVRRLEVDARVEPRRCEWSQSTSMSCGREMLWADWCSETVRERKGLRGRRCVRAQRSSPLTSRITEYLHILSAYGRELSYRCRAASQPSTCLRVTALWPRGWPASPDRRWVQSSLLGLRYPVAPTHQQRTRADRRCRSLGRNSWRSTVPHSFPVRGHCPASRRPLALSWHRQSAHASSRKHARRGQEGSQREAGCPHAARVTGEFASSRH